MPSKPLASIGRILLYAICVPIVSLFISLPLLSYLEDRLKLSEAGSSDLASLLVFAIGAYSTGWIVSLLGRLIKGSVTETVLRHYILAFFFGNGVAALLLAAVIALRHRYDVSVEAFLLAITVGLSLAALIIRASLFLISGTSK